MRETTASLMLTPEKMCVLGVGGVVVQSLKEKKLGTVNIFVFGIVKECLADSIEG